MIEVTECADRTFEMKLEGTIDSQDVDRLEGVLDPYAEDEGAVSAVIDVSGASDTLLENPSLIARLLAQFDKFARVALVTEGQVRQGVIDAFAQLMPQGAIRQFEPVRVRQARDFARGPFDRR